MPLTILNWYLLPVTNMSDIAPANPRQVAYDGTAQLREIITDGRELRLKFTSPNPFYLTPYCNTARGMVLDGTLQAKSESVRKAHQWKNGGKHGVEDGSHAHKIMMFLEARGGRATFAEIEAAFPTYTREHLKQCLREMKNQGIITQ